jgi:hypothetical protein
VEWVGSAAHGSHSGPMDQQIITRRAADPPGRSRIPGSSRVTVPPEAVRSSAVAPRVLRSWFSS